MRTFVLLGGVAASVLLPACVHAAQGDALRVSQMSLQQLGDLSLEQLGRIQVTSVSRRAEPLLKAPASIHVITAEEIRRTGARSLPEALRAAPNLHVARTGANTWAISARGFNNAIGNKLLVLVDGRTIYSPLFSGVFWEAQDVMLEDIERIEVISGPGATLWGANAVNGVINVITRPANATLGAVASAGGGGGDWRAAARWGGRIGAGGADGTGGALRLYGLATGRRDARRADGMSLDDASIHRQAGWRADWGTSEQGITFKGDVYRGGEAPGTPAAPLVEGANLLGRVAGRAADGSSWRLQAYWDRNRRKEPFTFSDDMEVADVEFQHSPQLSASHTLLWGAGIRHARDRADKTLLVRFIPAERSLHWINVFAQDEIALGRDVELALGTKLEKNVYTGWEVLPSMRLAWTPSDKRMAWAALSRAVRAPARLDREFFLPGDPPFLINGGPDFQSEVAKVLEVGWREQPTATVSWSATLFHHDFSRLRSGQLPPAVVQNMIAGTVSGIEAQGQWQATRNWRLAAGYQHLKERLRVLPGSADPVGPSALGNDPRYQVFLRSSANIGPHEFDITARRVGALPLPAVPAFTEVDVRWGWHVSRQLELSLSLRNLLDASQPQFGKPADRAEMRRAGWLQATWRM